LLPLTGASKCSIFFTLNITYKIKNRLRNTIKIDDLQFQFHLIYPFHLPPITIVLLRSHLSFLFFIYHHVLQRILQNHPLSFTQFFQDISTCLKFAAHHESMLSLLFKAFGLWL
jgi:hypothetical protein